LNRIEARIFNIQKFSTEDGPGIRTTVFMKGCPLRCAWCHNPEGMHPEPELMWYDVRCIAARECLDVCPVMALELGPQGMTIDRSRCDGCGKCAEACPSAALEVIGTGISPEQLLQEIIKDLVFYQTSGGGVTFSGGEPVLQAGFLDAVLPMCKEAGIHVALDSCGALPWKTYLRLLGWVDLVLLDLKIMDPQRHKRVTGIDNRVILDTARSLAAEGIPMWIRTPVIPGYTQEPANIQAIGEFIRQYLPTVERWDLLAYTNLGRPKYHRLDRVYQLENEPLLTAEEMEKTCQIARSRVPNASWSGATRGTGKIN